MNLKEQIEKIDTDRVDLNSIKCWSCGSGSFGFNFRSDIELERMKQVAIVLAGAIEDNKKASELGYQVYPLEQSLLDSLTKAEAILKGGE